MFFQEILKMKNIVIIMCVLNCDPKLQVLNYYEQEVKY